MPLGLGDVFVCHRIAEPVLHSIKPAQRPPARTVTDVWLVLSLCPRCSWPDRYCKEHGPNNWWLTTMSTKRS